MGDVAVANTLVDPTVYHPKFCRYKYSMDKELFEFNMDMPEFVRDFLLWLEQWYKEQKFDVI